MVSEEDIINRFSGLLDEETINALILYSLQIKCIEGVIDNFRIHDGKKGMFVIADFSEIKLNKPVNSKISNIKVMIDNNTLKELISSNKLSNRARLKLNGFFSGDLFHVKNVEVLKKGNLETIKGVVSAKDGNILICHDSFKGCISCYIFDETQKNQNRIDNIVKKRITAKGIIMDGDVMLIQSYQIVGNNSNGDIYGRSIANEGIGNTNYMNISEILEMEGKRVCVSGRVSGIGELRDYGRKSASMYISDDSGRVKVILLGRNVSAYKRIDVGIRVNIFGGKVTKGSIYCDSFSMIEVCDCI